MHVSITCCVVVVEGVLEENAVVVTGNANTFVAIQMHPLCILDRTSYNCTWIYVIFLANLNFLEKRNNQ